MPVKYSKQAQNKLMKLAAKNFAAAAVPTEKIRATGERKEDAANALTQVAAFVALAAPNASPEEIAAMIQLAAGAQESSVYIEAVVEAAREKSPPLVRDASSLLFGNGGPGQ